MDSETAPTWVSTGALPPSPMVNPGAIATTSLVPRAATDERWAFVLDGLSRFAGPPALPERGRVPLCLDDEPRQPLSRKPRRQRFLSRALGLDLFASEPAR